MSTSNKIIIKFKNGTYLDLTDYKEVYTSSTDFLMFMAKEGKVSVQREEILYIIQK